MSIFGFFFIILLVIALVIISIVSSVFRLLFGFGRRRNPQEHTYNQTYEEEKRRDSYGSRQQAPPRKKIFNEDEGEYVDFEEVKDEEK